MALRFENNGEKQRTPAKKRSRNISFYAALVLCVGAIVLTVIANPRDSGTDRGELPVGTDTGLEQSADSLFDDSIEAEEAFADTWYVSDMTVSAADVSVEVQTTTASTRPARLPSTTPTTSTSATTAAVPASAKLSFGMPTDGIVTSGFSGSELIFCATMCDWRVHNGVDISGQVGDEVKACADGVVEGFVEDMLYGNTAIVRHADDSVMYYCGLNDTQMVSKGLNVAAGDVIGYIGEVPCELADGPHVHLALMKDGEFIDPATVLPAA